MAAASHSIHLLCDQRGQRARGRAHARALRPCGRPKRRRLGCQRSVGYLTRGQVWRLNSAANIGCPKSSMRLSSSNSKASLAEAEDTGRTMRRQRARWRELGIERRRDVATMDVRTRGEGLPGLGIPSSATCCFRTTASCLVVLRRRIDPVQYSPVTFTQRRWYCAADPDSQRRQAHGPWR